LEQPSGSRAPASPAIPLLLSAASLQRTLGNRATARLLAGRRAALRDGQAANDSARPRAGRDEPEPVVQRKVGMEYETIHAVGEVREGEEEVRKLGYQEKVFVAKSATWKIVADSSNFEFVTEPVDETEQGRESLKKIIAEMRQFIDALVGMRAAEPDLGPEEEDLTLVSDIAPSLGTTLSGKKDALRVTFLPLSQHDLTAAPQATGGVPLDKIADLVEGINTTQLSHLKNKRATKSTPTFGGQFTWPEVEFEEDQRSLSGMDPLAGELLSESSHWASRYIETIVTQGRDNPEFAKWLTQIGVTLPLQDMPSLRGLLTLVMSYLTSGDEQTIVWDYSKIIAPLMSRTNFSALYAAMPLVERQLFDPDFILHVIALDANEPIFAKGYGTRAKPERGPTRLAWLQSIMTKSIDLMSLGGGSTVTAGHAGSSSSMGAQAKPDTGVSGAPLAVLELRRLPKMQDPDEWEQTALIVFDMFKRLSNPDPVAPEKSSEPESDVAPVVPEERAPESVATSSPGATPTSTTPSATTPSATSTGSPG
jgi:hypothetical protein